MIFANKKVASKSNAAQQNAQIISIVKVLLDKNLVLLTADTVYLDPQLWKTKIDAINWMNCLQRYYMLKKQFKISNTLYFKDLSTSALMGSMQAQKTNCLFFNPPQS